MPSKSTFLDPNIIQHTKYVVPPSRVAKKLPPKPWPLPKFNPFIIDNYNAHREPCLPPNTNTNNPIALFNLFYTNKIIDKLIEQTNAYTDEQQALEDEDAPPTRRKWIPTFREELYTYFGVLIHIGLTAESAIKNYQGDLDEDGYSHIVKKYISKDRFQQLNRYIRATKPPPQDANPFESTFNRINNLSEHLQVLYRKLYNPSAHITINKTIQRFIGRASEIVNIPSKPTPKGFRIWVLANKGYILDQIYYAKGNKKGPINLDSHFTKVEGFNNTEAIILDFLIQKHEITQQRLYPPGKHYIAR